MKAKKKNFHRVTCKYTGYPTFDLLSMQNLKLNIYSVIFYKNIENLFSYRFKLRPLHNIGGGTHFSGGTNPDSGGTFVPPFKLLKYTLKCVLI